MSVLTYQELTDGGSESTIHQPPVAEARRSTGIDSLLYAIYAYAYLEITGWAKKVNPKCSTHNFVKYWPILKILSLL